MSAIAHIRTRGRHHASASSAVSANRAGRVNGILAFGLLALMAAYALTGSMLAATTWKLSDAHVRLAATKVQYDAVVAGIAALDDREALTAMATALGMTQTAALYIVESVPVAAR